MLQKCLRKMDPEVVLSIICWEQEIVKLNLNKKVSFYSN